MIVDDLENVNPSGRVDVLAYRGLEQLTNQLSEQHGLSGIWDIIKPHVGTIVTQSLGDIELPTAAKVLLQIVQANYKPNVPKVE